MHTTTSLPLVAVLLALAGARALGADAAAAAQAATRPLVFVFTGESNSGGIGPNARATRAELGPRACVQIMNLTNEAFSFEDIRIGVNNLRDRAGLERYYAGNWRATWLDEGGGVPISHGSRHALGKSRRS